MKKISLYLLFLLFPFGSIGQSEFGQEKNGLIYSDTTMHQLKHIVDSLNLKHKVCQQRSVYEAMEQGIGHYFTLEGDGVKEARKAMDKGIGFKEVKNKFTKANIQEARYLLRYEDKDYDDSSIVVYETIALNSSTGAGFRLPGTLKDSHEPLKGKWIYQYEPKSEYSKESLEAFFITEDFRARQIPDLYAGMIQYADCLVDTTQTIFRYNHNTQSRMFYRSDEDDTTSGPALEFMRYFESSLNLPKHPTYDYNGGEESRKEYEKQAHAWFAERRRRADSFAATDICQRALLDATVKTMSAKDKPVDTEDEFEGLVEKYISKGDALEMKRRRLVMGGCSQDQSPRYHALAIARLSAETVNWEIFLRAHLDIMNDNFERLSDGSYAQAQRKTYIKELELLDINVEDLLLGISLRFKEANPNHYYGNLGRLGRAISETNDKEAFERKMLQMIGDQNLDVHNRALIYSLFLVYNYHLEDAGRKAQNVDKIRTALNTFPESLRKNAVVNLKDY